MGLVVVAYDIPNDRRRVRMHTLLSGFGENVQESVFEFELDDARLRQLHRRIEKIVRPEDKIRIYALCESCADRIDDGSGHRPQRQPEVYFAERTEFSISRIFPQLRFDEDVGDRECGLVVSSRTSALREPS